MPASQPDPPEIIQITRIAPEILEMIFGMVNFADLPSFLLVCKWINSAFKETMYGGQLNLVAKYDSDSLRLAYRQMKRNSQTEWQVRDVLKAFVGAYCECGECAWLINWLNNPPKRVCTKCYNNEKYVCTSFVNTLKEFGLTKRDVKNVPTILAGDQHFLASKVRLNSTLVQRSVIEDIARRKGRGVVDRKVVGEDVTVACVHVLIYDYRKRTAYDALGCYLCEPNMILFLKRKFNFPHNYESLSKHIADVHPEILDTFEAGWNALGADIQNKWQAFGHKNLAMWRSWAHIAFKKMEHEFRLKAKEKPGGYYIKLSEFAHNEVADLVMSNLHHSGSLFSLPNILGTQDIRGRIANVVTEMVIRKETRDFIQKLKKEIERDGLDVFRKYLSEYK